MGGGEAQDGVAPCGGQLRHGDHHKLALMHAGMWEGKLGEAEGELVDGYEVNVDAAVNVGSCGVAMR